MKGQKMKVETSSQPCAVRLRPMGALISNSICSPCSVGPASSTVKVRCEVPFASFGKGGAVSGSAPSAWLSGQSLR
ncbi:hypothetical protein D3C72_1881880 [compost metagenome]